MIPLFETILKYIPAPEGDMEAAVTWLRERGIAKAVKKEGAVAAEGLCSYAIAGNKCVTFELNSQTDFVAQNAKFVALLEQVAEIILNSSANNTEEALNIEVEGKTLATIILEASGVIGEKISLRRVSRITKADNEVFGAYKHMGGRIVTIAILEGEDETVAKDVAMQIAAMNPAYLDEASVPAEVIEKEKEILIAQMKEDPKMANKPEAVLGKIVEGKIGKYYKENCLVEQQFVMDGDITVGKYVENTAKALGADIKIADYVRFERGEGIEKRQDDLAAEVAKLVNG